MVEDNEGLRAYAIELGELEHFPLRTKHILRERGSWRIRLA